MDNENRLTLARYCLERAEECLDEAVIMLRGRHFNASISRSYYAVFNSLRTVLALDGVGFKKHSAVISYFQREYVKTGKFDTTISQIIVRAFSHRHKSDYMDFYTADQQAAESQIENAKIIVKSIKEYLDTFLKQH